MAKFQPPSFLLFQTRPTDPARLAAWHARERRAALASQIYDAVAAYLYAVALIALLSRALERPRVSAYGLIVPAVAVLGGVSLRRWPKRVGLGVLSLVALAAFALVLSGQGPIIFAWVSRQMAALAAFGQAIGDGSLSAAAQAWGGTLAVWVSSLWTLLFAVLSYHPWLQLIAGGAAYALLTTTPTWFDTLWMGLLLTVVCFRLTRERDYATIQRRTFVRRTAIKNNHHIKTAAPIVVVLLTLVLAVNAVVPPNVFYNKTIDNIMRRLIGHSLAPNQAHGYLEFSLRESGFYPLVNRLGGPVEASQTPYMTVETDAPSLYLRGAVYMTFDGRLWHQDAMDPNWLLNHQRNQTVQNDILGPSLAGAEAPGLPLAARGWRVVPLTKQQVVFNAGRVRSVTFADPKDGEAYVYFNRSGSLYLDKAVPEHGYIAEGDAFDVSALSDTQRLNAFLAATQSSFKPLHIDGSGDATRALAVPPIPALNALVKAHDETLYHLVYEGETLPRAARVTGIRERLAATFTYDMKVPAPSQDDDLVTSFFKLKRGYCTYFATTMVVLLREAKIPARYVEGFIVPAQPGGGVRTLTGENAHAWVEVWFDGLGWVPFDPTPNAARDSMTKDRTITPTPPPAEPTPTPPLDVPDSDAPAPPPPHTQPFPWTLVVSLGTALVLVLAYLIWRVIIYRRRHDRRILMRRFHASPKALVEAVWRDAVALFALMGHAPHPEETIRALMQRLAHETSFDHTALEPLLTVERTRYRGTTPTEAEAAALFRLYAECEQTARATTPRLRWLLRRFLWSQKHPL